MCHGALILSTIKREGKTSFCIQMSAGFGRRVNVNVSVVEVVEIFRPSAGGDTVQNIIMKDYFFVMSQGSNCKPLSLREIM